MKTHNLKTLPEYFDAVFSQQKPFEVRKDDRNFQVGEMLNLQKFNPETESYTGDELLCQITYKLEGGQFGIESGYCVLGLAEPLIIL